MNSNIVKFLRNEDTDFKGRKLSELLGASDLQLERSHDYIQWMFPSDVPSQHSEDAPVLTSQDIYELQNDDKVKSNLRDALLRMLVFFSDDQWITPRNHNYKRITRILSCLWLVGLREDYERMQDCLDNLYKKYPDAIGEQTYQFWKNANNDDYFPS
jgi:hypothetical protein